MPVTMSQHQAHQETSTGTIAALVFVIYLLSPFPVVWMTTRYYGGLLDWPPPVSRTLQVFYAPLFYAADKWKPIGAFYEWGLVLLHL
jgi:hypothetical protein